MVNLPKVQKKDLSTIELQPLIYFKYFSNEKKKLAKKKYNKNQT